MGTWTLVKRDLSKNVLQGTWAFKRKRYQDGRMHKLKARFVFEVTNISKEWTSSNLKPQWFSGQQYE